MKEGKGEKGGMKDKGGRKAGKRKEVTKEGKEGRKK
jgi:hypothetical protein